MMHSHLYDDLTGLPEYYKASQLKKRQMFEIAVHANQMFLDRIMEETIGFEAARESNEEEEDEGSENVYEN